MSSKVYKLLQSYVLYHLKGPGPSEVSSAYSGLASVLCFLSAYKCIQLFKKRFFHLDQSMVSLISAFRRNDRSHRDLWVWGQLGSQRKTARARTLSGKDKNTQTKQNHKTRTLLDCSVFPLSTPSCGSLCESHLFFCCASAPPWTWSLTVTVLRWLCPACTCTFLVEFKSLVCGFLEPMYPLPSCPSVLSSQCELVVLLDCGSAQSIWVFLGVMVGWV